jgi:dipeptidyl aminopeptidase/acylaminoacyl peptidase
MGHGVVRSTLVAIGARLGAVSPRARAAAERSGLDSAGDPWRDKGSGYPDEVLPLPLARPRHAYGGWPSPIGPATVTRQQNRLGQLALDGDRLLLLEGRPDEGGRVTLLSLDPARPGTAVERTPAPVNVRTRLHEYGGSCLAAHAGTIVLVDDQDQRLWRFDSDGGSRPISPAAGGSLRFAEPLIDAVRDRVVAVLEDHGADGEPENRLVAVPLAGGAPVTLAAGHDFFAYPRLSPDGRRLAWLVWDHPDMPWDATRLMTAEIAADGSVGEPRCVAGAAGGEAVLQPEFLPDGRLAWLSDRTGFWNLWGEGGTGPLAAAPRDMGGPLWQVGSRWWASIDASRALAIATEAGLEQLVVLDLAHGIAHPIALPYAAFGDLLVAGGTAYCRAAGADRPAAVIAVDLATGSHAVLRTAGPLDLDPAWISRPRPISFASRGGRRAYGFHYPPTNPEVAPPPGELPPLIVRSHGGPTGAASPALRLGYQFWTSRGFAIVDVDYAGSSGHGRAYREALNGQWGIADVEDCIAAALHLVAQGEADPDRLVISGGSAGGFTTLAALTFHDTFKAGCSTYGIGDLEALMRTTHKFEARYLDRLIGPWPEAADIYRARSPIHHTDRLACPLILFQGLEDKVVPPAQSEAMRDAVRAKGLPVAYLAFPGEGHGFRAAATQERVLMAEYAFYCRVFGIESADELPPLEILNLPRPK